MPALLCVPITVESLDQALADAATARSLGADLVEFRIDGLFSGHANPATPGDSDETRPILKLVAQSPLPCIVTCRLASEGGQYDGDETDRVSLYERLGTATGPNEHPPRFLDFELAAFSRSANIRQKINLATDHPARRRELAPSLILSAHDFDSRPADLSRRVLAMHAEPASQITKIAFRARSLRDNLELFELLREAPKPMIALAMGEFGLMSRVLAGKFGAFLTFAALKRATATAPGQPTVSELLGTYRFRSISSTTRVYGVIGSPVSHSLSPLIHNAAFEAAGFDAVYLPLPIPPATSGNPDDTYLLFKATLGALVDDPSLDFHGASVTLPHKENLVRFATERSWTIDPAALAIGAANTLVIERSAGAVTSARVLNTDSGAAIAPIVEAIGPLAGVEVGVVGAGGVARAVVYGLMTAGARVTVYNRDLARAQRLAADLSQALTHHRAGSSGGVVSAASLDTLPAAAAQVFINCTPVGMKGGPDPVGSPIPVLAISNSGNCHTSPLVLDTVYNPIDTPLLTQARQAGWRSIDGVEMFVRQAQVQSQAWTGRLAPGSLFDRVVREALAV
ncbi:MAG: type I 3-dehydroquinate dehydratase [Planctomycetota bacterium]